MGLRVSHNTLQQSDRTFDEIDDNGAQLVQSPRLPPSRGLREGRRLAPTGPLRRRMQVVATRRGGVAPTGAPVAHLLLWRRSRQEKARVPSR
jgi:hypothetical protein